MSGDVSNRKRLISVTGGNVRNQHLCISGHHDFFPKECYGESSKADGFGVKIALLVEGLSEPAKTDLATDGENDRPGNFFRNRPWGRQFFHVVQSEQTGN